ncbi:MAG: beta-lactamase family protein [Clostridia bacterium]|nr:beta-lactamase family protein [Clostridia bacterium]
MYKRMRSLSRLFFVLILASCFFTLGGCSKTEYPDSKGWEVSTPEAQGMDSEKLSQMFKFARESGSSIHSLLIIRKGKLVTEANFFPYQKDFKHILYSCTKSVTSSLVGIAVDEGKIKNEDEKVLGILKDIKPENLDAKKENMSVKHLLTMSAGFKWNEEGSYGSETDSTNQMQHSKDALKYVLDYPVTQEPGKVFYYNTGASHVLSGIVKAATGISTQAYAKEKLFKPLGIEDVYWQADSTGLSYGGFGLFLTPADMAKFGYLYLKKGTWDGKRIISEKWVDESTKKQIDTSGSIISKDGYGYQWWQNSFGGYSARGFGGQFIFVLPKLDMVVVLTGCNSGTDYLTPEHLVKEYIIPAVKSTKALEPNTKGNEELNKILHEISTAPMPKAVPELPETARRISGKVFEMEDSSAFSITFNDKNVCLLTLIQEGKEHVLPVGLDDVYRIASLNQFGPLPDNNKEALKGYWSDSKTFVMHSKNLVGDDELEYYYTFENDKAEVYASSKLYGSGIWKIKGKLKKP